MTPLWPVTGATRRPTDQADKKTCRRSSPARLSFKIRILIQTQRHFKSTLRHIHLHYMLQQAYIKESPSTSCVKRVAPLSAARRDPRTTRLKKMLCRLILPNCISAGIGKMDMTLRITP
ncbi:MAG TPA: hypothetical protein DEF41_09135 [Desulfovibrio sp.]|uniref:Uncharacterized protein n=1 Tax=Nitratidesulfovibrio vulgaris (strain ATCC 29579 / DSM 644 / CCUG 34227 / NCIMB 8303 / VKM B-1760 / Hildenborough) TaxID=882 RepID=Q727M9_NITV2|nr:hypothetical protein DVU_2826 [Nitratidesulfovibrio vulgaris str. Hildenborough]HBW16278.1 hypothetical protein [Desulfovibrio sp.]